MPVLVHSIVIVVVCFALVIRADARPLLDSFKFGGGGGGSDGSSGVGQQQGQNDGGSGGTQGPGNTPPQLFPGGGDQLFSLGLTVEAEGRGDDTRVIGADIHQPVTGFVNTTVGGTSLFQVR